MSNLASLDFCTAGDVFSSPENDFEFSLHKGTQESAGNSQNMPAPIRSVPVGSPSRAAPAPQDPLTVHMAPVEFPAGGILHLGHGVQEVGGPETWQYDVVKPFEVSAMRGLQIVSYETQPGLAGRTYYIIREKDVPQSAQTLRDRQVDNIQQDKFQPTFSFLYAKELTDEQRAPFITPLLIGRVEAPDSSPSYLASDGEIGAVVTHTKIIAYDHANQRLSKIPKISIPTVYVDYSAANTFKLHPQSAGILNEFL